MVLSLPTLVFTCRDSTIRTKCLPCQSAEGGTSTAIRANWQHLHSSEELLTSVPTPAASGTSVARSNRPLRSPRSAEADQRFAPGPGAGGPSFPASNATHSTHKNLNAHPPHPAPRPVAFRSRRAGGGGGGSLDDVLSGGRGSV